MAKKSSNVELRIVFIFILIVAVYFIYQKYGIPLQIADTFAVFIYDTEPQNNAFIKDGLSVNQLKKLDVLLNMEQSSGGLRLSTKNLEKITKSDQVLNEAYYRWRKCKEMMRSKHHSIYPNERHLYKKK